MKRVQLTVADTVQSYKDCVILAEKNADNASWLPLLSATERSFVERQLPLDINNFFFPRAEGSLCIRLLKPENDQACALEDARLSGNEALRDWRQYKIDKVTLHSFTTEALTLAFAEGAALGSYQFLLHFSEPEKKNHTLAEIALARPQVPETSLLEWNALVEAVSLTRDLVNEPFSHLDAVEMAERAVQYGADYGFSVEMLEKEQLQSLKMGGILAVNRASDTPPFLAVLEWKPENARNTKPVVLVGKGVVYDTGGLSLKPSEGMDYMKCDMAGAAAVLGTVVAAAKTGLPVHIVGLLPITDNKIGQLAYAPGDVIRMYSGKTVEVVNTDAEGRLILADALAYGQKYQPSLMIDVATLTGAAVRTLGYHAACYMGNAAPELKRGLEHSGYMTYERLSELPLWREYNEELKSPVADLRNIGSVNAGMITAAKFLEHFTGDTPWLHIDIAGPAYLRSANAYRPKEGSGYGVRLLYHFLKNHA